jgi:hypothetical protein
MLQSTEEMIMGHLSLGNQAKANQESTIHGDGNPEAIIAWLCSIGRSTVVLSGANAAVKRSKRRQENAVKRGDMHTNRNTLRVTRYGLRPRVQPLPVFIKTIELVEALGEPIAFLNGAASKPHRSKYKTGFASQSDIVPSGRVPRRPK